MSWELEGRSIFFGLPKHLFALTSNTFISDFNVRQSIFRPICYSRREKERCQAQTYDKRPYTHKKLQKAKWQHKNTTKKLSYATTSERLRRSIGVTTDIQLGWLTVYGIFIFQLTATGTTAEVCQYAWSKAWLVFTPNIWSGWKSLQLKRFQISLTFARQRQKRGDLTQSCDKNPYTNRNVKRAKWQH